MKRKPILPRGVCRECGKEVALRAPTGNYLDALFPRRHRIAGSVCVGTWHEVEPIKSGHEEKVTP